LLDIEIRQHLAIRHFQSGSLCLPGNRSHAVKGLAIDRYIPHRVGEALGPEPSQGISAPKTTGFHVYDHNKISAGAEEPQHFLDITDRVKT
jgi:hypothetical protein